jgi:hypothetical protein
MPIILQTRRRIFSTILKVGVIGQSFIIPIHSEDIGKLTRLLFISSVAAALSITTLYRSSRQTSKRAYNAGYGAACQDLLVMIQQGVSVGGVADPSSAMSESVREATGNEMTIGKVMDWIEARLEAVKSREEEEDEDEEKERSRGGNNTTASAASVSTSKPSATVKSGTPDNVTTTSRHKDHVRRITPSVPNLPTDQFSSNSV